jgi:hypothetical protein
MHLTFHTSHHAALSRSLLPLRRMDLLIDTAVVTMRTKTRAIQIVAKPIILPFIIPGIWLATLPPVAIMASAPSSGAAIRISKMIRSILKRVWDLIVTSSRLCGTPLLRSWTLLFLVGEMQIN